MSRKETIMVVDDDPTHRKVFRKLFEREGYNVADAKSGEEALANLKEVKPDLVLMDVIMQDTDGWEATRAIKKDIETKDIPVVMFTVRGSEESVDKSYNFAHADFHLNKPSRGKDILRVVRENIKK